MTDTVLRLPGSWEIIQTGPDELNLRRTAPWAEAAAAPDCDWIEEILEIAPGEVLNQIGCLEPQQQALLLARLSVIFNLLQEDARYRLSCPARAKRLTPEDREAIINLFQEGLTNMSEIARRVGTTPQTIRKILREEKLVGPIRRDRPHRGTHGWMYY